MIQTETKYVFIEAPLSNQRDLRDMFEEICIDSGYDPEPIRKACDIKGVGLSLNSLVKFCKMKDLELNFKFLEKLVRVNYSYEYTDPDGVDDTITDELNMSEAIDKMDKDEKQTKITRNLKDVLTITDEENKDLPDFMKKDD